jgi:AcrR family transcriptional regulator
MRRVGPRPPSRREEKKLETRERLLRAALDLFVRQGYAQTRVDEIARAAHVSRQTFFNYFPEKSHLLDVLLERGDAEVAEVLEASLSREATTEERLERALTELSKRMEAAPDLGRVIFVHGIRRTQLRRFSRALERVLEAGVARGEVRSDLPVSFLAEMTAGACTAAILVWVEDPSVPLARRLPEAAKFALQAAAPPRDGGDDAGR